MAKSINQVILMGRLTRDPEVRTTTTGKTITSFSIAVDRGGQEDQADFFDVTAWEKLGELVSQYLSKGRRCLVQGRLRQDSWDDKETGQKRYRTEILVNDLSLLSGRDEGGSGSSPYSRQSGPSDQRQPAHQDDYAQSAEISDDDIPF